MPAAIKTNSNSLPTLTSLAKRAAIDEPIYVFPEATPSQVMQWMYDALYAEMPMLPQKTADSIVMDARRRWQTWETAQPIIQLPKAMKTMKTKKQSPMKAMKAKKA